MRKRFLILILCLSLLLTGCIISPDQVQDTPPEENTDPSENIEVTPEPTITSRPLSELPPAVSEPIYRSERSAGEVPEVDLKVLYLTVMTGDTEETNHTWTEINKYSAADYEKMGVDRYKVAGILREGTENGVDISDEDGISCTVSFRGQASSKSKQKSYKIKLSGGTWMDQKVLNLNKHYPDSTRYLNKLAYDIIDEVPQMIGLKTQFVRLYVKDLSQDTDPKTAQYVDYGLFTHVEQLNGRAIKRLGLEDEYSLYKINGLEFWEYDDIKLMTDPEYDVTKFESRAENKGTTDNEKLLALMDAVNNGYVSDQELLDYYVEKENVAYWMAFQILFDNVDNHCRNFYLYSPASTQKWYLIAWDNDGGFARLRMDISNQEFVPWRYGVHNYWSNGLFRNLLRTKDFREALVKAATDLKENYMTKEHMRELLDLYEETVGYVILGDADGKNFHKDIHEKLLAGIPDAIQRNYDILIDSLNCPTPYFIGGPSYDPTTKEVYIGWNPSYDFEGRSIVYIVEISTDPSFENILYSTEVADTRITYTHEWGSGQFFVRISAKNSDGYIMRALTTVHADGFGDVYGSQTYTVE